MDQEVFPFPGMRIRMKTLFLVLFLLSATAPLHGQ
jgi:hypothetical protein